MTAEVSSCEVLGVNEVEVFYEPSAIHDTLKKFESQVNELWEAAKKKNPKLEDGSIAHFVRMESREDLLIIVVDFVDYRYFYAQQVDKRFKMGVKPVGVSGYCILKTGELLFGHRSFEVTQYPNFIEVMPSGGITRERLRADQSVDVLGQLAAELKEETGILKKQVRQMKSICVIFDKAHKVYDLGCRIDLKIGRSEMESLSLKKSSEYSQWSLVASQDLRAFIKKNIHQLVPTSVALLEAGENL
jgi:hypothetical protein